MMPNEIHSLALDVIKGALNQMALGPSAILFCSFAANRAPDWVAAIKSISAVSPFRHMATPGGCEMSVALTNCDEVGWIRDRTGYRYGSIDPVNDRAWRAMPAAFAALATEAANAAGLAPMPA
jgi:alkylated DNA repair protein (DNA oxidative demethylase)